MLENPQAQVIIRWSQIKGPRRDEGAKMSYVEPGERDIPDI